MKFDIPQGISLAIAVLALAYFVGHSLHKKRADFGSSQSVPPKVMEPSQTGNASTSGDQSPAITGSGNSVEYKSSEPTSQKHKAGRK
jgi:hypothetical protein